MGMHYVGDGTFIQGIPARDLTEPETARWRATIIEQQRATGIVLYVEIVPGPVGRKGAKPAKPGEDA